MNEKAMLASMNAKDKIEAIEIYLNIVKEDDEQLAAGLKDITKNINKCWEYIEKRAKKELNNKNGYISPNIIYGWAVHYFTEDENILNESEPDFIITSEPDNVTEDILESIRKSILG